MIQKYVRVFFWNIWYTRGSLKQCRYTELPDTFVIWGKYLTIPNSRYNTLTTRSRLDANFALTGGISDCNNDNHRCHEQQRCHHEKRRFLSIQRTHSVISILRQNDVATSFWSNNNITSYVRWAKTIECIQRTSPPIWQISKCARLLK